MAKQTVSEEEIRLRKRARRRLIGAIALAVLAAILLPMVFDDQVKPVGNVQIQIPDEKTAPPFQPAMPPPSSSQASAPVPPGQVKAKAVVAEKPAAKPAVEPEKTAIKGEYVVQIGVFSNEANVRDIRRKLVSAGIRTYVEAAGDKTRVRAGPYPSRSAAEIARKSIARSGVDGVVEAR